mmetsp:Transcript_69889/g.167761  ORF Transcript_69889/g.167761 Transcript_69889/m.167761 type:complete len:303 (-) Transcript_69889:117-1025(-)
MMGQGNEELSASSSAMSASSNASSSAIAVACSSGGPKHSRQHAGLRIPRIQTVDSVASTSGSSAQRRVGGEHQILYGAVEWGDKSSEEQSHSSESNEDQRQRQHRQMELVKKTATFEPASSSSSSSRYASPSPSRNAVRSLARSEVQKPEEGTSREAAWASSSLRSPPGVELQEETSPGAGHSQPAAWSVGSALHGSGRCDPCAHFWKPGSCFLGAACDFCHLCSHAAFRRRHAQKRSLAKFQQRERRRQQGWAPQLGQDATADVELAGTMWQRNVSGPFEDGSHADGLDDEDTGCCHAVTL